MPGGICGSFGRVGADVAARIRQMLGHRGGFIRTSMPAPGTVLCSLTQHPSDTRTGGAARALVYAGRITNLDEIARITGEPADSAHALMRLHEQLGCKALKYINGSFAIAWYDSASQSLMLGVDRWAIEPLYFAHVDHGCIFASEYKALLAALPDAAAPDAGVAGCIVSSKYLPIHRTLDARIVAAAPGEYVRLCEGGCEFKRYAPLELDANSSRGEEECATELREHILAAAERLTRDHDEIGVGLSAGLDSAITLGALRRVAPRKRIYAYTVSFDQQDPTLDKAAEVAEFFGAVHRRVVIPAESLPQRLETLVWRMEDPIAREEMVVYDAVAQSAASETTLVLYGHMADVLFGGMPRHLLIKAASELPLLKRAIIEFYDYTQVGTQPRSALAKLLVKGYFRGRHPSPPRLVVDTQESTAKSLQIEGNDPLNLALLRSTALPSEVSAIERLHGWAGVPMGSIFHDMDVSLCAFRIPSKWKIRGLRRKHILRVAGRAFIPEKFAERPKDLIRIGRSPGLRAVVANMSEELLSPEGVRIRGMFEPGDVTRIRNSVRSGRCSDQDFYYLWSLMLLELWCRTFVDKRGSLAAAAGDRRGYGRSG